MTIRTFYQNTKELNESWKSSRLENISVIVEEKLGNEKPIPRGLVIKLTLYGELSSKQIERIEHASSNCPVKQVILGGRDTNSI